VTHTHDFFALQHVATGGIIRGRRVAGGFKTRLAAQRLCGSACAAACACSSAKKQQPGISDDIKHREAAEAAGTNAPKSLRYLILYFKGSSR